MSIRKENRYDLANLPISEVTRNGLTKANIQTIGAIGRMLSLQDDVYDEQFEKILRALEGQSLATREILTTITQLKDDVGDLKVEVIDLKKKIGELTTIVFSTRDEVAILKEEVEKLKKKNNIWAYSERIAIGAAIAAAFIRFLHGPFGKL
jgi:hypothetical protein